jgi:5-methylcytosine-specific restriction endonuclease McrA
MECPDCKRFAFVIEGKMACCDLKVTVEPTEHKRMSLTAPGRRIPPRKDRQAILRRQEQRCLYCRRQFGAVVYRHGRMRRLRIHWDHMTPFAFSQDNRTSNFAAACNVCNNLKASLMFQTVEEAEVYLHAKWEEKGYSDSQDVRAMRRGVSRESPVAKVL